MSDPLRIIITLDGERNESEAEIPHSYATQIETVRRMGIDVRVFGVDDRTSIPGVRRNLSELKQAVDEFRPDLVVAYYGTMVGAVSRAAAGRIPLVVTFQGSDVHGTSNPGLGWRLRDGLGRLLSLWAASGSARILLNGADMLPLLPDRLKSRASILPTGIDAECFSPEPMDQARGRLGWDPDEEVILFNAGVGTGKVVKNRPLADAVAAILVRTRPGVRLAAISGLSRAQVAAHMNASNLLLLTSLHEGSPGVVKEAMACNLPVVTVPCGDVVSRLAGVSPGGVGPYDAAELAALAETVLQTGRRSNGREKFFEAGLDIASATERTLAVYRLAAG